jgi:leucyl aminopeptidase
VSYTRDHQRACVPLLPVAEGEFDEWLKSTPERHRRWLVSSGFKASPGKWCSVPDEHGHVEAVVFGMAESGWLHQLGDLPQQLPPGCYRLVSMWSEDQRIQASIGWGLAAYRFGRYLKEKDSERPVLLLDGDIADIVEQVTEAQCLVRDLVNTPTEDMGPGELADAVLQVADRFAARVEVITGEELLNENHPAIHAVGRAAARPPRLVTLSWGEPEHPLLALVGKGVCFDSGGLDIKPAAGMLLMKKDMGGAAHALALAQLVMQFELPVRLLLLIPAVENAISGNAYRPGDVIDTRKGLTVEIGNTDAEGRLILADALALACENKPDMVIDFATLTGAARIALGADLPPVFSNHGELAQALATAGERVEDPLWAMPLFSPYKTMLKSEIADLNNVGNSPFAGCITAALFLEHFVDASVPWVHIDTFAWNQSARPGRPKGGEALGLRAVFNYLRERYA